MASSTARLFLLALAVLVSSDAARSSPNGSGGRGQVRGLARQFLQLHNAARLAVGVPPVSWDRRLAGYARWYANQRRGDCLLVHSKGPYGENLFWGSGVGWSPAQIVGAWTAERSSYDYSSNSCRGVCGHWTQIVWKDTARVGCAVVVCSGGRGGTFAICSYDPPGNYVGMRPY
ncbi:pathogenesis-related protein PR-1-like [Ananas comosus]|uniref:Pathogenesis-related protein PR-1 n=1 Tax=Ananas comosus TaxID=4615 RepID=A0A199UX53_ANACO|nr:pathogenesis-related protein PR-1-like [Ananas comosus]OAY69402.1 Pathogenesis-related protein PR-1 [Ananas comosus]